MIVHRLLGLGSVMLLISQLLVSQEQSTHRIALQPVIWLEGLFPKQFVGVSIEYETAFAEHQSALGRLTWFRDPNLTMSMHGVAGGAVDAEYRYYFNESAQGWHVGPFVEWARHTYIGSSRPLYGRAFTNSFVAGVIGGHRWITRDVVFDIALRTAFYGSTTFEYGAYMPKQSSTFNGHLLISAGIVL